MKSVFFNSSSFKKVTSGFFVSIPLVQQYTFSDVVVKAANGGEKITENKKVFAESNMSWDVFFRNLWLKVMSYFGGTENFSDREEIKSISDGQAEGESNKSNSEILQAVDKKKELIDFNRNAVLCFLNGLEECTFSELSGAVFDSVPFAHNPVYMFELSAICGKSLKRVLGIEVKKDKAVFYRCYGSSGGCNGKENILREIFFNSEDFKKELDVVIEEIKTVATLLSLLHKNFTQIDGRYYKVNADGKLVYGITPFSEKGIFVKSKKNPGEVYAVECVVFSADCSEAYIIYRRGNKRFQTYIMKNFNIICGIDLEILKREKNVLEDCITFDTLEEI